MTTTKPKVMVYVPIIGGAPIIAGELRRSSGRISVLYPAHVQLNPEQTRYVFSPLQFITGNQRIYESGIIADGDAAPHILTDYEAWVAAKNKE